MDHWFSKYPVFVHCFFFLLFLQVFHVRFPFCCSECVAMCYSFIQTKLVEQLNILEEFFFFFPSPEDIFSLLFSKRGREEGRKKHSNAREKHRLIASHACRLGIISAQTRDWIRNLGICPDWGSNLQPLGYQTILQPAEPHQPGPWRL